MTDRINLAQLLAENEVLIAPSMLKCDYAHLNRDISLLEAAGAKVLHWDVMDGQFVPNLSYGALLIKQLRNCTELFFDTHLMISDPERYLDAYLDAGSDAITIHREAVTDPTTLLRTIRQTGVAAGLALNPETPIEDVLPYADECDLLLVMSVEPGFGGQKFMPVALDKLKSLKSEIPEQVALSVDGGLDVQTISATAEAGAEIFVAGSSIFETEDYSSAITALKSQAVNSRTSKCG